jgi:DNA invertase Pin-like site-specific DNA recombinase
MYFLCSTTSWLWYDYYMRIALYARVSTKDRGQDHENQLRELREFVSRKKADGWQVVEEFIDRASGKTSDRPAFQRMFEQASRKEFDLLVFWSLDRFSREGVTETLNHLQRLTSYGIDWFSYREEYLRSIGGFRDAVLAILAAIAKQERVRIQERVIAGLARARATGTKSGKPIGRPAVAVNRTRVWKLKDGGASIRKIAQETGLSHGTVQRALAARES